MNGRILKKRIASLFRFAGVEAILVVNTGAEDPNFIYMTDLAGGLFEGNLLLVTRKGVTLFTSPLLAAIMRLNSSPSFTMRALSKAPDTSTSLLIFIFLLILM